MEEVVEGFMLSVGGYSDSIFDQIRNDSILDQLIKKQSISNTKPVDKQSTSNTEEPEVTLIGVDNSYYLDDRRGGGAHKAQARAIVLYSEEKLKAHPDNEVGILGMGLIQGDCFQKPTRDLDQIRLALKGLTYFGQSSIPIVQALTLLLNSNLPKRRLLLFFGGALISMGSHKLESYAKRLKELNVAVGVVNFGMQWLPPTKKMLLEEFVKAADNDGNSHYLYAPSGSATSLGQQILCSPLAPGGLRMYEEKKKEQEVKKKEKMEKKLQNKMGLQLLTLKDKKREQRFIKKKKMEKKLKKKMELAALAKKKEEEEEEKKKEEEVKKKQEVKKMEEEEEVAERFMLSIGEYLNSCSERVHNPSILYELAKNQSILNAKLVDKQSTSNTEEPEVTLICVDNSYYLDDRRGGGAHKTQARAIVLYSEEKLKAHPDNEVGILGMGLIQGDCCQKPTRDLDQIRLALKGLTYFGQSSIPVRQALALLLNSNLPKRRLLLFFGGALISMGSHKLESYAKRLKEFNVAVDVVNFGMQWLPPTKKKLLEAFIKAADNDGNSHYLYAPSGSVTSLGQQILCSPLAPGGLPMYEEKKKEQEVKKKENMEKKLQKKREHCLLTLKEKKREQEFRKKEKMERKLKKKMQLLTLAASAKKKEEEEAEKKKEEEEVKRKEEEEKVKKKEEEEVKRKQEEEVKKKKEAEVKRKQEEEVKKKEEEEVKRKQEEEEVKRKEEEEVKKKIEEEVKKKKEEGKNKKKLYNKLKNYRKKLAARAEEDKKNEKEEEEVK